MPCPPAGNLPNPRIKSRSPTLQVDSLPSEPPGKPMITGVGSLSLLQGIFPTQESNRCLLHGRQILYQLSYQGSLYVGHFNICVDFRCEVLAREAYSSSIKMHVNKWWDPCLQIHTHECFASCDGNYNQDPTKEAAPPPKALSSTCVLQQQMDWEVILDIHGRQAGVGLHRMRGATPSCPGQHVVQAFSWDTWRSGPFSQDTE